MVKLYYKKLERCKISLLKFKKGKYNIPFMHLSISVIAELNWLLKHPKNRNKSLQNIPVSCKILTDASEKGWRATHKNTLIGGR